MLVMMLNRLPKVFRSRQLIGQVSGFVYQHRQALRTDVNFISLEFNG
jgi:hypothetical protein